MTSLIAQKWFCWQDANKFLLHQSKVWYILNDRINYIFDLPSILSPVGIKFFEKHNPFNELVYLTSRQNREIFELNAIGHEPSY